MTRTEIINRLLLMISQADDERGAAEAAKAHLKPILTAACRPEVTPRAFEVLPLLNEYEATAKRKKEEADLFLAIIEELGEQCSNA